MKSIDRECLIRGVDAQIAMLRELKLCLEEPQRFGREDARFCLEVMKKIESGIRRIRLEARDFEEYRDLAVSSMISRI